MAQSKVEEFLERNRKIAEHYPSDQIPTIHGIQQAVAGKGGFCIVTCADPRVAPEHFMSVQLGESAVIRNAGGRAKPALNEIIFLNELIGGFATVMVIHHTDCGCIAMSDEATRQSLTAKYPEKATEIARMTFNEITDLDESIREDVAIIKASPYLKNVTQVYGFRLDTFKGHLHPVN